MTLPEFFQQLISTPIVWVVVALTLGVILVNGWTDAPNAIATCVATRAMRPQSAIIMAAVFNFLGVFVMTLLSPNIAESITKMVNFGDDANAALIAICAAMFSIVTWAVLAWMFAIPTSESHALIAGLTGAALAINGGFDGVNGAEWMKVLYGIGLSLLLGFGLSYILTKLVQKCCKYADYGKSTKVFKKGQIAASAGMAFMHGAQDGQKFISIFLFCMLYASGSTDTSTVMDAGIPIWLMIVCSIVMGLGTSIGGMKIIKSVGMDMVKLEAYQGCVADVSSTAALLTCSLTGMPVSTTHAKATAIMGVGAAKRVRSVNWNIAKEMVFTWLLTFPGCGLISYFMTKVFLWIF